MMWLIRINLPYQEPRLLESVNINYDGVVVNFKSALLLYKNRHTDILRFAPLISIDPDLTFMTCASPSDKETVMLAFNIFNLKGYKPKWDKQPLDLSALRDDMIKTIATKSIDLQREFAGGKINAVTLEFFGIRVEEVERRRPRYILFAPYFVVTHIKDPEYEINKKLLEYSIQAKRDDEELYAVIALDKALLSNIDALKQVLRDYVNYSNKVDGYAVWIVDFDETEEDFDSLRMFALFTKTLKERSGKPVINLYGGYFSLLLSKLSIIDGIVTKICYRQRRSRCIVDGGPPIEQYYFSLIKTKMNIHTVALIVHEDQSLKCKCPICSKHFDEIVRKELEKPRSATNELKKHFLYAFGDEIKHVSATSLNTLLNELKQNYEKAESLISHIGYIDHLITWYNVISKLSEVT